MAASLAVVGGRDAILCSALKGEFERGGGPARSPFASAAVSFPRGRGPSVRTAFASTFKWGASSNVGGGQTAVFSPCRPQRNILSSRTLSVVAAGTIERSYIMIKPDGVQRGIVGEIISRFERKGFTLKGLKLFQTPKELAEEHYGELKKKPFFPNLVKYILSGPVVAMVWEGPGIVAAARKLIGVTNPLNAEPGTIRGDFGVNTGRNVIHGSDSPENGEREIALWFKEGEVVKWEPALTPWILE